jgi:heme-degrading monooxygenase HmoA
MFAVLIEAEPRKEQWDAYLGRANSLGRDLNETPGFVDDIRYRSLAREGWILSLSRWRDEASILGWHTRVRAAEAGWSGILTDYRVRVGEITSDTSVTDGRKLTERRLDGSGAGNRTYVTLIDAMQTPQWVAANNPQEMALYLGFDLNSYGDCISWDIFDSLSRPGEIILMVTWKDEQSANDHAATQIVPDGARVRVVRIVRDDAMSESGEAPLGHDDEAGSQAIGA